MYEHHDGEAGEDHADEPRVGPEPDHPLVTESDPSGDAPHGLAGTMGVSSERVGRVPGMAEPATHGAVDTHPELPDDDELPPEQTAGGEEPHPANDVGPHPFDPRTAHLHSHG